MKNRLIGIMAGVLFFSANAFSLNCPAGFTQISNSPEFGQGYAYGAATAAIGFAAADNDASNTLAFEVGQRQNACTDTPNATATSFSTGAITRTNADAAAACIEFGGAFDCEQTAYRDVLCCAQF